MRRTIATLCGHAKCRPFLLRNLFEKKTVCRTKCTTELSQEVSKNDFCHFLKLLHGQCVRVTIKNAFEATAGVLEQGKVPFGGSHVP